MHFSHADGTHINFGLPSEDIGLDFISQNSIPMIKPLSCYKRVYSSNLQAKYFYVWQSVVTQSQDARLMERMAVLHHDQALVRAHFGVWRLRAQLSMEEAFKMVSHRPAVLAGQGQE